MRRMGTLFVSRRYCATAAARSSLRALRRFLPAKNSGQISRLLKRLRVHGLIKKVGHTYKYYLTRFGKAVITTGLKLRELVIIPQLALGTTV